MSQQSPLKPRPLFPRWANLLLPLVIVGGLGAAAYVPVVVYLGFSPKATDVGYSPEQPVPYSHALHVGELGLDCRYCHTSVTQAAFAAIPSTQTCMNCHSYIRVTNPDGTSNKKLEPLWDAWDATWRQRGATYSSPPLDKPRVEGKPVEWVKIHDLPDFAYFNHEAHTTKGIGCISCHGRIDQMEVVYQAKPLSMSWCLECHREPEKFLRPADQLTNMQWTISDPDHPTNPNVLEKTNPEIASAIRGENKLAADVPITQHQLGSYLKKKMEIKDRPYMTSCSTCHR